MSKFRIGDRVRRTKGSFAGMNPGDEAIVTSIPTIGSLVLESFEGSDPSRPLKHDVDSFELVTPATSAVSPTAKRRKRALRLDEEMCDDTWPEPRVTNNAILLSGFLSAGLRSPYKIVEVDAPNATITIKHDNGNRYRVRVDQISGQE